MAVGNAYRMMGRQASMLSYENAFWGMAVIVALMVPLPFIMRKPAPHKPAPEESMGH
jgi:DHA2 family multidrug resistance protein